MPAETGDTDTVGVPPVRGFTQARFALVLVTALTATPVTLSALVVAKPVAGADATPFVPVTTTSSV